MGAERYANGSVVYTSEKDVPRMCVEALNDDAHYRFQCRCGCGAQFAGYGKDIKAAAKVGGTFKPVPAPAPLNNVNVTTSNQGADMTLYDDLKELGLIKPEKKESVKTPKEDGVENQNPCAETAEKLRPFVSDRYLQKAIFGLSDEEIDQIYEERAKEGRGDVLEEKGYNLSLRQPPAIGELAYSIVSGEGPFTLVEYVSKDIEDDDGLGHKVLCGLLRARNGRLLTIPLADLDTRVPESSSAEPVVRSTDKSQGGWLLPAFLATVSSVIGSAVAYAYFIL